MNDYETRKKIETEMVNIYAVQFGINDDSEAMEILWDTVFPGRRNVYFPNGKITCGKDDAHGTRAKSEHKSQ
jgi:hypothetical protein